MKVHIKALNSCIMRKQRIEEYVHFLKENGHELVPTATKADAVLVWSCAFRNDFREASLTEIDHLADAPSLKVLVGGCLPDIDPEALENRPGCISVPWRQDAQILEEIFGNQTRLDDCIKVFTEEQRCVDAAEHRKEHPKDDVTFHDQFIKAVISEGCNYNCAYCSEKLAFPEFKSMPLEQLVQDCKMQVEQTGVTDVMLMADSLGQYGMDIGLDLPALMDALKESIPNIRIALSNLNPIDILNFKDWFRKALTENLFLHLNLPMQSASDSVLKAMNRPYSAQDLEDVFELLAECSFVDFDTHLIVGFPTETEEDIKSSVDFCIRNKVRYVLLSQYMEASKAPSAKLLPKVSVEERQERIDWATRRLQDEGIICNSDGSSISKERIKRLFMEKRDNVTG